MLLLSRSIVREGVVVLTRCRAAAGCSGPDTGITKQLTLLTAVEAAALHPLMARDLTLKLTDADGTVRGVDVLVARAADGKLHAYENNCPHQGGPLNARPGRFFSRAGRSTGGFLVCARHGAVFSPDDGVCVRGPCAGHALHAVPIDIGSEGSVTITIQEANRASLACLGKVYGCSVVAEVLHPPGIDAALALATAEAELDGEGTTDLPGFPKPRTAVPLDGCGMACTWDANLGCWRASNGSVHFARSSQCGEDRSGNQ